MSCIVATGGFLCAGHCLTAVTIHLQPVVLSCPSLEGLTAQRTAVPGLQLHGHEFPWRSQGINEETDEAIQCFSEEMQSIPLAEIPLLSAPLLRGPYRRAGIADCMLTALLRVEERAVACRGLPPKQRVKPGSSLCAFLGGGWILGSQPGTLLGGCSLPSFSLSLEPSDLLSHLSGISGLGSGEGWRDCPVWVAAVLRTIRVAYS